MLWQHHWKEIGVNPLSLWRYSVAQSIQTDHCCGHSEWLLLCYWCDSWPYKFLPLIIFFLVFSASMVSHFQDIRKWNIILFLNMAIFIYDTLFVFSSENPSRNDGKPFRCEFPGNKNLSWLNNCSTYYQNEYLYLSGNEG